MSVSAISALTSPTNASATTSSASTTQVQHKHGAHSLKGDFAVSASNALGMMGKVAVSSATGGASHGVMTALNSLKSV